MCSCTFLSLVDDSRAETTGPAPQVRRFDPEPTACREVRRFVGRVLGEAGIDADIPELLASELASNAIRHGKTSFLVRVSVWPAVRVEIRDGNAIVPTLQAARGDDEAGRGLLLVEALADRWGVEECDGGKAVWFEHLPAEAPPG